MNVMYAIAESFLTLHTINLTADTITEYINDGDIAQEVIIDTEHATRVMTQLVTAATADDMLNEALTFTDLSTIRNRMQNVKSLSKDVKTKSVGWVRVRIYKMKYAEDGRPTQIAISTEIIQDEKEREEELQKIAMTDSMTMLLNRRAYDDDIAKPNRLNLNDDFVYLMIDINGLKMTNDKLSHAAGDELIIGAAQIIREAFGRQGQIYRLGGDEFVVMLHADDVTLKEMLGIYQGAVDHWSGTAVDHISMAVGLVKCKDHPDLTIEEIAKLADQEMYADKDRYYEKTGLKRRTV